MHNPWEPTTSAVVIMDIQNSLCHPRGGALADGQDPSEIHQMMPQLLSMVSTARRVGALVVHVRSTMEDPSQSRLSADGRAGMSSLLPAHHDTAAMDWGLQGFLMEEYATDLILLRKEASAFEGTLLDSILRAEGISSVLFAGLATPRGMHASVQDAGGRGYGVALIHDCCAAHGPSVDTMDATGTWHNGRTLVSGSDLKKQWAQDAVSMAAGS